MNRIGGATDVNNARRILDGPYGQEAGKNLKRLLIILDSGHTHEHFSVWHMRSELCRPLLRSE